MAQTVAQTESNEMQYIEPRGQLFWFRRRIPGYLAAAVSQIFSGVARVGKNGYLRFSLKTSDKKEAIKRARKFAVFIDEALAELKPAVSLPPLEAPAQAAGRATREEIQRAADRMYAQLLSADEDTAERSIAAAFAGTADVREPDRFSWTAADLPPASTIGQVELLKKYAHIFSFFLYTTSGKTIDEVSPDLLPFADAFRRYVSALERRKAAELVPTPELPPKITSWTWDDALDYYASLRPEFSDDSKANYRTACKSLEASAKCQPAKLTADDVVLWRDNLLKDLGTRTVKSRLTFVSAIWRESRANGKIDRKLSNPFEYLRVVVSEKTGTARKEFSMDELCKIFEAPPVQTARAVSRQAGYWLPLLALYHDARLEELTGLEVADVKDDPVCLLLHIRENTIRPRLKHRKHSERLIPVHPKLLELGFKDYVVAARTAGVQALFPSFSSGATFGEEFVKHVKKLLTPVAAGRLVGMHCFRHSWETARRTARLDISAANYIGGRAIDKGSSAIYGGPAGLQTLFEELSKITYDIKKFLPAPAVTAAELQVQAEQCQRARRSRKA